MGDWEESRLAELAEAETLARGVEISGQELRSALGREEPLTYEVLDEVLG